MKLNVFYLTTSYTDQNRSDGHLRQNFYNMFIKMQSSSVETIRCQLTISRSQKQYKYNNHEQKNIFYALET